MQGNYGISINEFYDELKKTASDPSGGHIMDGHILMNTVNRLNKEYTLKEEQKIIGVLSSLDLSKYEAKYRNKGIIRGCLTLVNTISNALQDHYVLDDGSSEYAELFETVNRCQAFILREITAFCTCYDLPLQEALFEGCTCFAESYVAAGSLYDWAHNKIDSIQLEVFAKSSDEEDKTRLQLTKIKYFTLPPEEEEEFMAALGEIWGTIEPNKSWEESYKEILDLIETGGNLYKESVSFKDHVLSAPEAWITEELDKKMADL